MRSYIVLFQFKNGDIGYTHFIKGWNGKFKINQSGYGPGGIAYYQDTHTNKRIYAVVVGNNPERKINHFKWTYMMTCIVLP